MELKHLKLLLKALRDQGVTLYKTADMELSLLPQDRQVAEEQEQLELTPEQLAEWSIG